MNLCPQIIRLQIKKLHRLLIFELFLPYYINKVNVVSYPQVLLSAV